MTDEDAARRFLVEAIEQYGRDRDLAKAREMRGKECPIQRPMFDRWPVRR